MLIQANKHVHNGKHKKKQMSKLNKKENNNNTTDMFFYINQYLLLKKKNICNKKLFFFIFNLATSLEMYMIFFLLCLLFHTLYISFKVFGILPFWYFNDDERRIVIWLRFMCCVCNESIAQRHFGPTLYLMVDKWCFFENIFFL